MVFVVGLAGRQVENANRDDNFVFKVEAGFSTASQAEEYVRRKGAQQLEMIGTPQGEIECYCERKIFPLEIGEREVNVVE